VRRFWKGDGGTVSEFASRLCGSSDLYQYSGRRPYASINFITCHDGFDLQDLVSYNDKHNEANGEDNRDGANDNNSWNCGAEGPTDDPAILALRGRQKRNLMATLLLSQGVPMILAGDELSHTQKGNNNTYCQDSDLTWLNWELNKEQKEFLEFTKRIIAIWREQPVLKRRKFFQGRKIRGTDIKDVVWYEVSGKELPDSAWDAGFVRCLGVRWSGDVIPEMDERGEKIVGDTLLILLNAHHEPLDFVLPATKEKEQWERMFDTADPQGEDRFLEGGKKYPLKERSLTLWRLLRLE
jgi:glycogen operon protein